MLENETRKAILDLINREVVPAVGCTEPMSVALCTAKATELLGCKPTHIKVLLSANILKNAMGVGIPGTGMIGLPIAVSLGSLIGKSAYQLEVIKDLTPESLADGKQFVAENRICIGLKENNTEKLYVEVTVESEGHQATTIISGAHTCFVFASKDDEVLFDKRHKSGDESEENDIQLNMKLVWDFAMTSPINELSFILKTKEYNLRAAQESRKGNYGHCLGKTMDRPLSHGIYAEENENTEEELIRALTLSHLTAIYIKQSLGKLSALCGCVVASIGSSCGITYLMGGTYQDVCHAVKNMIANLTGMICDGAKPSCSLKICSGVSTALLSALLAREGRHVTAAEGIIDECVDRSIHNLTSIGKEAMCTTDDMVLRIMTSKQGC